MKEWLLRASAKTAHAGAVMAGGGLLAICGVALGVLIVALSQAEIRWLVYGCAGIAFVAAVLMVRNQAGFLWLTFVLALQLDVTIRFLYLYQESEGLSFPLPVWIGLALLMRALANRCWRPVRWGGRLMAAMMGLAATTVLAISYSSYRFIGWAVLLTQAQLCFIFFLALNYVRSANQLRHALDILFLVLIVQSLIYYVQTALGLTFTLTGEAIEAGSRLPRPGGTVATHPSGFCNFMLPLMLIAVAHFLAPATNRARSWYIALAIVLSVGALVLTLTRASWAAFALGLLWIALFGFRRRLLSPFKFAAIGVIALTAGLAGAPKMMERIAGAPVKSSYDERAALMEMAKRVIVAHPLVGVGPGAYDFMYKKYLTGDLATRWQWTVHNHYLLRSAETGIPGGAMFVLLLLLALRQAMRLRKSSNRLVSATALGWSAGIVSQLFSMYWDMWTFFTGQSMFWFLLGIVSAAEQISREEAMRSASINESVHLTPKENERIGVAGVSA